MSEKECACREFSCILAIFWLDMCEPICLHMWVCVSRRTFNWACAFVSPGPDCNNIFQRWHLIHANKSPRRPSAFCQAYPMSRNVSTQAGVIKDNRWLGEWSKDKRAWGTLPNLIFQPWEASSETTTIYILIFNTKRGIQLKTASFILLNPFQLYLA